MTNSTTKPIAVPTDKNSLYDDDTVRLAPAYAFYQENILSVINRNSVNPDNPKEIFTGCFRFGDSAVFGDATGALPYPETVADTSDS